MIRLQCKTSSLDSSGDTISFSTCSTRSNSNNAIRRKYTDKEIDFFCTYYDNQCYLIPVNECSTSKMLRLNIPKNSQVKGINFAKDYTAEIQIEKLKS